MSKMGCGTSKQGKSNEKDTNGRNNSDEVNGSQHEKMDISEDVSLLPNTGSIPEDRKQFDQQSSQREECNDVLEAVLNQHDNFQAENWKLCDKISKLEAEKQKLCQELLQERKIAAETKAALEKANEVMDEYARKMSHIMKLKNSGGHEVANNPFSPSKLGVKLKTLYEDQGLPLLEYFNEEVEGAKFLSDMMKSCYDLCKKEALSQVKKFCFLDRIEIGKDDEGDLKRNMRKVIRTDTGEDIFDELCYLRWKTATSEEAINYIKENVSPLLFKYTEYPHITADEVKKDAVKSFLQECVETCWLIATCHPALRLRFDIVDLKYEMWIKQAFRVFATQKKVQSDGTLPGVIVAVLCPALLTADESIIIQGEVIVTQRQ